MQLQTVDLGFEHLSEKVFLKPPAADYELFVLHTLSYTLQQW